MISRLVYRLLLLLLIPACGFAQADGLLLKVELKKDRDLTSKGQRSRSYVERPQLAITLVNFGNVGFSNLHVVSYLFARAMPEKNVLLVKKESLTNSLPVRTTKKMKTDFVRLEYQPPLVAGGKTTPASGAKYAGHGVQVFDGDKLLAEEFVPSPLKEHANLTQSDPPSR